MGNIFSLRFLDKIYTPGPGRSWSRNMLTHWAFRDFVIRQKVKNWYLCIWNYRRRQTIVFFYEKEINFTIKIFVKIIIIIYFLFIKCLKNDKQHPWWFGLVEGRSTIPNKIVVSSRPSPNFCFPDLYIGAGEYNLTFDKKGGEEKKSIEKGGKRKIKGKKKR